jgi:hypothetical protein
METKMHVDEMTRLVTQFLYDCNGLQTKKNLDYHPDKVAYLEILRTACETGVTVEQDLWGRVRKQLSALRRYVIEGHTESEPPRSRMTDVAVYMGMMAVWDQNKERIVYDALNFINDSTSCERRPDDHCNVMTKQIDVCDRCAFQSWLNDLYHHIKRNAPKVQAR